MKKAIYSLILLLSGSLIAQDAVDNIIEGVDAPSATSELNLDDLVGSDAPVAGSPDAQPSLDSNDTAGAPDKAPTKKKVEKKKVTKITKPKPKSKVKNQSAVKVIKNVNVDNIELVQDVAVNTDGAVVEVAPNPVKNVKSVVTKRKGGLSHIIISGDNPNAAKSGNNKAKVVSSSVRKKKVPILGNIPVVGDLFSSTEKVVETKEIPVHTVNSGTVLLGGTDKDGVSVVTEVIVDGKKGKIPVRTVRKGRKVVNPYSGEMIITTDGQDMVKIAQKDPNGNIVVLTADEVTLPGSGSLRAERKRALQAGRTAKKKAGGMRVGSVESSYGDPLAPNQDNRDQRIANLEKKVAQLLKELEHLRHATQSNSPSRRRSALHPLNPPKASGSIGRSSAGRTARTLPPGLGTTAGEFDPFNSPKPSKPLNPPRLPKTSSRSPFAPATPDAIPGVQPVQPRAVRPPTETPLPKAKSRGRSYYYGGNNSTDASEPSTPGARSGNSGSRYYYNYKAAKPPQASSNSSLGGRSSSSRKKRNPNYWTYPQPSTGARPEPMRNYGSTSSSRKGSNEAVLTELSRLRGEMAQIRKLLERALSR